MGNVILITGLLLVSLPLLLRLFRPAKQPSQPARQTQADASRPHAPQIEPLEDRTYLG